jgi:hypothetical protein
MTIQKRVCLEILIRNNRIILKNFLDIKIKKYHKDFGAQGGKASSFRTMARYSLIGGLDSVLDVKTEENDFEGLDNDILGPVK